MDSVRMVFSQRSIMPMKIRAAPRPTASSRLRDASHAIRQIATTIIHQGIASSDSSTCRNTTSIRSLRESKVRPKLRTRNFRPSLVHSRSGI